MEEVTRAEALVRAIGPWLVHIVELCSVLVIVYGVGRAFLQALITLLPGTHQGSLTSVRLGLGQALSLALEFLLAADIVETMISPSLQQVTILGAVATIRTALNYFLAKELESEKRELQEEAVERQALAASSAAPPTSANRE